MMNQQKEAEMSVHLSPLLPGLLSVLKKQGFNVLLLGIGIWYFHGQTTIMQKKVDDCHHENIEIYKDLLTRNIKALEAINELLENKKQ